MASSFAQPIVPLPNDQQQQWQPLPAHHQPWSMDQNAAPLPPIGTAVPAPAPQAAWQQPPIQPQQLQQQQQPQPAVQGAPSKLSNNGPPPNGMGGGGAAAAGGGSGKLIAAVVIAVFFVLCAIGLAIALGIIGHRYANRQNDINAAVAAANAARTCPDTDPGTAISHPPNVPAVFDPFTADQLNQISAYVCQQLNISPTEGAVEQWVSQNWLFALDFMPGPKATAVAYLDGPALTYPGRYARAIVFYVLPNTAGIGGPTVVEYQVGPIPSFPIPANTPVTPIQQPGGTDIPSQTNIPIIMRPVSVAEYALLDKYVAVPLMANLGPVVTGSYGSTYDPSVGNMWWTDSAPRGYDRNERTTWIWFCWYNPGMYHLSMGMDILIDHSSLDYTQWKVLQIVYNSQVFNTYQQLVAAYTATPQQLTPLTYMNPGPLITDWVNAPLFSSMIRRGAQRPLDQNSIPMTAPQGGQRWGVSGRQVAWMGWDVHLGMSIIGGLIYNDIRFRGQRIVYELALQDAFAGYSGWNPVQATSTYSDAGWGLGDRHFGLIPGVDCPNWATYLDSTFLKQSATATTITRTICIWEQPDDIAIMRHYDQDFTVGSGFTFVAGYPRTSLMIRTTSTVYNYDYILTLILHLDGVIEVNSAATGYPQGELYPTYAPSAAKEADFSMRMQQMTLGSLHDHMWGYKVDLDVLGSSNTLLRSDLTTKLVQLPYVFPGANTPMKYFLRTNVTVEGATSSYVYNPTAPTLFGFTNPGATQPMNAWGNMRAYQIYLPGTIAQLNQPTALWMPAVEWTKTNVAVTVRHDNEYYSSRPMFDMQAPSQPIYRFSSFTNGENMAQADLVAWVTVGTLHQPGGEDMPITTTASTAVSFFLKPTNYFDESPTTDLSNYYYRTGTGTQFPGCPSGITHSLNVPPSQSRCTDPVDPPDVL